LNAGSTSFQDHGLGKRYYPHSIVLNEISIMVIRRTMAMLDRFLSAAIPTLNYYLRIKPSWLLLGNWDMTIVPTLTIPLVLAQAPNR
jgi:hypothetical protein